MLSVTYAECHLCWVSHMLSVSYAECHLCWVSLILTVTFKHFMLNVVMLSSVMLSVMAPKTCLDFRLMFLFSPHKHWKYRYREPCLYKKYNGLTFCGKKPIHVIHLLHSSVETFKKGLIENCNSLCSYNISSSVLHHVH
jgi:hypothetical protein